MLIKLRTLVAALLIVASNTALAELAIIGHPDVKTGALDTQKIRNLFLGERNSFPSGHYAVPFNHSKGSPDRKTFFAQVLNMPESAYKRHWKRKISVGTGHPPAELSSHEDVLKTIANTSGSIGYIDAGKVNKTVKVLLTIRDIGGI